MIVRLASQNRMVTKGYRKGVYEWVTGGISCAAPFLKEHVGTSRPRLSKAGEASLVARSAASLSFEVILFLAVWRGCALAR